MEITFLGGAKEVGKSAILVDTGSEKILLDYGCKINVKPTQYPELVKGKLKAIIVSHCHLDHSGGIPILYRHGQTCPTFGNEITKPLAKMLWKDSYKIAREEGEEPKFSKRDIKKASKHFQPVDYREPFKIGKTKVTLFDAGHIPGSCLTLLETKEKKLLYTGDINLLDTRLIKGADLDLPQVDVLITESTYADREHPDRDEEERKFIEAVEETLANEGIALISCFAVARAQEIILILDEFEVREKIYLDGMAKKATNIINLFPQLQREYNQVKKALDRLGVKFIKRPEKRKKLLKKPCIIVTTSGMLSGGPISFYLEHLYEREDCALLLTGFQVPGTEGATLLQTGRYIHKDLDLEVKMNVRKFDFSSHASRSQLFEFVKLVNPSKVFCVHGDNTERFAKELREDYGFDAVAPSNSETFEVR